MKGKGANSMNKYALLALLVVPIHAMETKINLTDAAKKNFNFAVSIYQAASGWQQATDKDFKPNQGLAQIFADMIIIGGVDKIIQEKDVVIKAAGIFALQEADSAYKLSWSAFKAASKNHPGSKEQKETYEAWAIIAANVQAKILNETYNCPVKIPEDPKIILSNGVQEMAVVLKLNQALDAGKDADPIRAASIVQANEWQKVQDLGMVNVSFWLN